MTLAADPLNAPSRTAATTATAMTAGIQQGPLKCKKCRRALVARDSVVTHTPGQGQASFGYRKRDATLHISEVMLWMDDLSFRESGYLRADNAMRESKT